MRGVFADSCPAVMGPGLAVGVAWALEEPVPRDLGLIILETSSSESEPDSVEATDRSLLVPCRGVDGAGNLMSEAEAGVGRRIGFCALRGSSLRTNISMIGSGP